MAIFLITLTLPKRRPNYSGSTLSISLLLMSWVLASLGHRHPWSWLWRIGMFLSYMRKDFTYLCQVRWVAVGRASGQLEAILKNVCWRWFQQRIMFVNPPEILWQFVLYLLLSYLRLFEKDNERNAACIYICSSTRYTHSRGFIHYMSWYSRDQSRNAPSQWHTSLHCNDVSHWLDAYLDWSLPSHLKEKADKHCTSVSFIGKIYHCAETCECSWRILHSHRGINTGANCISFRVSLQNTKGCHQNKGLQYVPQVMFPKYALV